MIARVKTTFFSTPATFRAWLSANHATAAEPLVGFHEVDSGKPRITWPQSVDQALSFGWIDGVRATKRRARERRLRTLIADAAAGRTIGPFTRPVAKRATATRGRA